MTQPPRLEPGTTLGGYEIVSFIAAGGMGSVYRARNRILGDLRAIKVILPHLASNTEFVQRFVREAQLAARVAHPNVVKMLEPAMDGETMFLPMELLEGESLSDLARREAPLHPTVAIDLMVPICAGLHALHQVGIIHRDIKPANVFLAKDEHGRVVPKIIDLGAARDIDAGEQTQTGAVIGSAHYMPIEQAAGRRDIDLRVDIYAVGVMLYLLLTRKRPYENDETGVAMAKVLQGASFAGPREHAPWLPVELEQAVLQMLSRDREHRPSSALELIEMLNAIRPLCVHAQLPPPVRERHVTSGVSISQPVGLPESNSIRLRGLQPVDPQSASVAHGVTAPVQPTTASPSRAGLFAGIGLAVALLGAGAFGALKFMEGSATTESTATSARPASQPPSTPIAHGAQGASIEAQGTAADARDASTGSIATRSATPAVADAAVTVAVSSDAAIAAEDLGRAAARRADAPPQRQGRTAPREPTRCVPRPGVPCM
jgi:serine/threonine protein kinase